MVKIYYLGVMSLGLLANMSFYAAQPVAIVPRREADSAVVSLQSVAKLPFGRETSRFRVAAQRKTPPPPPASRVVLAVKQVQGENALTSSPASARVALIQVQTGQDDAKLLKQLQERAKALEGQIATNRATATSVLNDSQKKLEGSGCTQCCTLAERLEGMGKTQQETARHMKRQEDDIAALTRAKTAAENRANAAHAQFSSTNQRLESVHEELNAERSYKWLKYAALFAVGVVTTMLVRSKPVGSWMASVFGRLKFW